MIWEEVEGQIELEEYLNVDPLLEEAKKLTEGQRQLRISTLQLKLRISFRRAEKIFNQLERDGVIDGSGRVLEKSDGGTAKTYAESPVI